MISIPEQGQLVEVRRRQWVVADVLRSTMADGSPTMSSSSNQHLITLSSIDEDALGEEAQVVWEIEPGARILEKAGLPIPSGIDDPETLDAFLDAVQWGAVTNADRSFLQAPFRSGISIEDYQLDPLVRAIDMAHANLLIADDVGLGKTIEAGLVIHELILRHRAHSVLVVCPASLLVKWQSEIHEKFGLEFRIVNTDYIKHIRRTRGIHANPWTSYPRLITSMDWMKNGEPMRLMKDALPPHVTHPRKFDILVVDEAHNVAPAAAIKYALESQRTRLIRAISPHFEHKLFLSATPHNGYQESFTSLLELLDDQRFARTVMPDQKQLERVMVRRLKTDIVDNKGNPVFPARRLMQLEIGYTDEEREMHRLLCEYTKSREESVKGTKSSFGAQFIHSLLKKRLFSSPAAFASTLQKHCDTLTRGGSTAKIKKLDERILRRAILRTEEEYANDIELENALEEATVEASSRSVPLTDVQRALLDRLTSWANLAAHRPDSKANAILRWLEEHLKNNGKWNERRVIFFTEYRATHSWLHEILTSHGYGGNELMILHGDIDGDEREKVKAAFQTHPNVSPVRILLATDVASEGIDLQNHCNYLIHVEIPWNPNVMEQRNGRIDRHGQKEEVLIWHPVGRGFKSADLEGDVGVGKLEGDLEYLMRAVMKLNAIREDLGSVAPVIAQQIEEGMSGKRNRLDTRVAEKKATEARKFVKAERKLKDRIARLHERILETKEEFQLTPNRIRRAVQVGMALANLPPLQPITPLDAPDKTVFDMPMLHGSWARCMVGLSHPHTGERRPITFDHEVAKDRDDVVLVHLNHPLVNMCLRLLRAQVWALEDVKKLHRVTIKTLPDEELECPITIVVSRLLITGGNHRRLHEELTVAGGELQPRNFSRITKVTRLNDLIDRARPATPSTKTFKKLVARFQQQQDSIILAAEARSRDRLNHLKNTLERRKNQEIEDVTTVLDSLASSIESELNTPKPEQLELWPEEQRNQLRRDIESLRARLNRIPKEREQEIANIEARYAEFSDHTFPVAIIFLIPKSMMEKDGTSA